MIAPPKGPLVRADIETYRRGSLALIAFSVDHIGSFDQINALMESKSAFEPVNRDDVYPGVVVRCYRPAPALLDIVCIFGGTRAVNLLLHAFGFDPNSRAV